MVKNVMNLIESIPPFTLIAFIMIFFREDIRQSMVKFFGKIELRMQRRCVEQRSINIEKEQFYNHVYDLVIAVLLSPLLYMIFLLIVKCNRR